MVEGTSSHADSTEVRSSSGEGTGRMPSRREAPGKVLLHGGLGRGRSPILTTQGRHLASVWLTERIRKRVEARDSIRKSKVVKCAEQLLREGQVNDHPSLHSATLNGPEKCRV